MRFGQQGINLKQKKGKLMCAAKVLAIASISLIAVTGCNQDSAGKLGATINQASLCHVEDWQYDAVSSVCKPGQKVAYLPSSFGNEQLPVIFAAVNCDLRYSVALTKGAVACIYGPITPSKPASTEATPPSKQ